MVDLFSVEPFLREHGPLILKHARRFVRASGLPLAPEDVAHEAELMVSQLAAHRGLTAEAIPSVDAFFRGLAPLSAQRVKRRRTLLAQVAAGDDLHAVSADVRAVDGDLPDPPRAPTEAEARAFAALASLKRGLSPADALVAALWLEDDFSLPEIAARLHRTEAAVDDARVHIEAALASWPWGELAPEGQGRRGDGVPATEARARAVAALAVGPAASDAHVDPALIRLVADGDTSDDIADAMTHLAFCPDCRAILTEGEVSRRSVVVLAIEAPKEAQRDLTEAAHEARARLLERGEGRWAAVVEPSRVHAFRERLGREDSSLVARLAQVDAVDLPVQHAGRRTTVPPMSAGDGVAEVGTSAAEVNAWARIAKERRRRTIHGPHLGWLAFAVVTIAGAAGVAYVLAQR